MVLVLTLTMFCVKILVKSERYLEKKDTVFPYVTGFRDLRNCRFFDDFKALNEYFQSNFRCKCSFGTRMYENKLQIAFKVRISAIISEICLQVIWCRVIKFSVFFPC